MKMILVAALLLAPSGVAFARSHNDNVETGDPNRVICRTEQRIGSRLKGDRKCLTAAQWAELKRETRVTLDQMQGQNAKSQ